MEDYAVRAVIIGVSLFVTMITLSAVLMYFNTARSIADEVNKRTDIAQTFDEIVNGDKFEMDLTGVQIRSLINKYAGSEDVEINILTISGETVEDYMNINHSWLDQNTNLISEAKMSIIDPAWTNHVDKVHNFGKITLNIRLDV